MDRKPSTVLSFFSLKKTCTDTVSRLTENNIPFFDLNIHCYAHPVYYGDGAVMAAHLDVGSVAFFQKGNMRDIHLKNFNAGSNGVIAVTATVPNAYVAEALKL